MSKRNKRRNKKHKNKHHIIPSSRGGTSNLENIAIIDIVKHQDYHVLFVNQTPVEIVENLVQHYWNGNWDYVKEAYEKRYDIHSSRKRK